MPTRIIFRLSDNGFTPVSLVGLKSLDVIFLFFLRANLYFYDYLLRIFIAKNNDCFLPNQLSFFSEPSACNFSTTGFGFKRLIIEMYPLSSPIFKAVSSKSFLAFISAPFSIRYANKSNFPAWAALCKGVLPQSSLSVILQP